MFLFFKTLAYFAVRNQFEFVGFLYLYLYFSVYSVVKFFKEDKNEKSDYPFYNNHRFTRTPLPSLKVIPTMLLISNSFWNTTEP